MDSYANSGALTMIAYNEIKDAIYSGKLAEGDYTSEVKLSRELAMSRTPIRKAVKMLENEGFLEVLGGAGILIKGISYHDIYSLYAVRESMETLAAMSSVSRIPESELDAVEKRFLDLQKDKEKDPGEAEREYAEMDRSLHNLLVKYCDNNYIPPIMEVIESNAHRYRSLSALTRDDLDARIREHLWIIECIRNRNEEAVIAALRANIRLGRDLLTPEKTDITAGTEK